ncbi:c-type cytochrome biogenesis protein CcmI [soil metagenome]
MNALGDAGFFVIAASLVALAWWMLMAPGRTDRLPTTSASKSIDANVAVLRDHLAAVDAERSAGTIDRAEYRTARAEIEARLFEDETRAQGDRAIATDAGRSRRGAAAFTPALGLGLGLVIAVAAFGIYGFLGNLAGLTEPAAPLATSTAGPDGKADQSAATTSPEADTGNAEAVSSRAVEAMLEDMAQRMQSQKAGSTDATGWALLGRSYAALQRFDSASDAYARAIALSPNDAQLLVDRADVLSVLEGGSATGEANRLVVRALQIDPNNVKGLALARAMSQGVGVGTGTGVGVNAAPVTAGPKVAQITGRITLAPALAARISPDDTVFVFARAETGPRMPLAVARYKAGDLPIDFKLDDSGAMAAGLKLSNFERIVVGARVSRSGSATPVAGDLRGQSAVVGANASGVAVLIETADAER